MKKRILSAVLSLALLTSIVSITALQAMAYQAGEKTFTQSLDVLYNFNTSMGAFWSAKNPGTSGNGSKISLSDECGYGVSGKSLKWVYDKSQTDGAQPALYHDEAFNKLNDGLAFWYKTDAAGTLRIAAMAYSVNAAAWVPVEAKVAVTNGENLVTIPWRNFVYTSSGTRASDMSKITWVYFYLDNDNLSGVVYLDQLSTYTADGTEVYQNQKEIQDSITVLYNFDENYTDWEARNVGENGSVISLESSIVYGGVGKSLKWVYDKQKATGNNPSLYHDEAFDFSDTGLLFWLDSSAAGSIRIAGMGWNGSSWVDIYADVGVVEGENIVKVPWTYFVYASNGNRASEVTKITWVSVYPTGLPETGTLYIDQFGRYLSSEFMASQLVIEDEMTILYDFNDGLMTGWSVKNAGTGTGSVLSVSGTKGYGQSGSSLEWSYDKGDSSDPAAYHDEAFNFDQTGLIFWADSSQAGILRIDATGWNGSWVPIYADVEVVNGENIVKIPWDSFKLKSDGTPATGFDKMCWIHFYALTMNGSGKIYFDQIGCYYEENPDDFVASTIEVPTETILYDFEGEDIKDWSTKNGGSEVKSSVIYGYGQSGKSLRWIYNKANATNSDPVLYHDESFTFENDGLTFWLRAEAAGTMRITAMGLHQGSWVDVYADFSIAAGENKICVPWYSFKFSDGSTATDVTKITWIHFHASGMPESGTMFFDHMGTYKLADTQFRPSTVKIEDNVLQTLYDFEDGTLTGWSVKNDASGAASAITADTLQGYGTSGCSLKWTYDLETVSGVIPALYHDAAFEFAGTGLLFWLNASQAGTIRLEAMGWNGSEWVPVYADLHVKAGESIVKMPWRNLLCKADNSRAAEVTKITWVYFYAQDVGTTGTMYMDQMSVYEAQEDTFTPATKKFEDLVFTIYDFESNEINNFQSKGNGHIAQSGAFGYGTAGQSLKWTVTDSTAILYHDEAIEFQNTGLAMWLDSSVAGTIAVTAMGFDGSAWVPVKAEFAVVSGENIVLLPWTDFVRTDGGDMSAISKITWINFCADATWKDAVLYIDNISYYLRENADDYIASELEYTDAVSVFYNFEQGEEENFEGKGGAIVRPSVVRGYGDSGKSLYWKYVNNASALYHDEAWMCNELGLIFWLYSDQAGTLTINAMGWSDSARAWIDVTASKAIQQGENIVKIAWEDFSFVNSGETADDVTKITWINFLMDGETAADGTVYIDQIGTYDSFFATDVDITTNGVHVFIPKEIIAKGGAVSVDDVSVSETLRDSILDVTDSSAWIVAHKQIRAYDSYGNNTTISGGKATISFVLPEGYKNAEKYFVVRSYIDDSAELIDCKVENGMVTFETYQLGNFALVVQMPNNGSQGENSNVPTGVSKAGIMVVTMLIAGSLAVLGLSCRKKVNMR